MWRKVKAEVTKTEHWMKMDEDGPVCDPEAILEFPGWEEVEKTPVPISGQLHRTAPHSFPLRQVPHPTSTRQAPPLFARFSLILEGRNPPITRATAAAFSGVLFSCSRLLSLPSPRRCPGRPARHGFYPGPSRTAAQRNSGCAAPPQRQVLDLRLHRAKQPRHAAMPPCPRCRGLGMASAHFELRP